jgi:hypothetical protein
MNKNWNLIGKNFILNNNKQKIKMLENECTVLTNRENKIIDLQNSIKAK